MIYTQIMDNEVGEKNKNEENIRTLVNNFYLKLLVPMMKSGNFSVWQTQWYTDDLYKDFKEV